jgi:hypothetical protein
MCTPARWALCPAGYEPASGGGHLDCESEGWCCVEAPASTCSDSGEASCVEGECTGCWEDAGQGLTGEAGRSCFAWIGATDRGRALAQ